MKFFKIQTNRVKLKKIIGEFTIAHTQGEFFVSPRPLPKQTFKYYVAFACVIDNSKADLSLQSVKNHSPLSGHEFIANLKNTEYYWFAGDREAYNKALHSDGNSAALH